VPILQQRGLNVPNADKAFSEIDTNHGGYILFDEFCHYAIKHHMVYNE
jgi:hypothetical protein